MTFVDSFLRTMQQRMLLEQANSEMTKCTNIIVPMHMCALLAAGLALRLLVLFTVTCPSTVLAIASPLRFALVPTSSVLVSGSER